MAFGGRVAQVATAVDLSFFAPHIHLGRVGWWFGTAKQFLNDGWLGTRTVTRAPVNVPPDGSLTAELLTAITLALLSMLRAFAK